MSYRRVRGGWNKNIRLFICRDRENVVLFAGLSGGIISYKYRPLRSIRGCYLRKIWICHMGHRERVQFLFIVQLYMVIVIEGKNLAWRGHQTWGIGLQSTFNRRYSSITLLPIPTPISVWCSSPLFFSSSLYRASSFIVEGDIHSASKPPHFALTGARSSIA